jgi:hypothetical protein
MDYNNIALYTVSAEELGQFGLIGYTGETHHSTYKVETDLFFRDWSESQSDTASAQEQVPDEELREFILTKAAKEFMTTAQQATKLEYWTGAENDKPYLYFRFYYPSVQE